MPMEQTSTTRSIYTPLYEGGRRLEIRGMAASSIRDKFYQVSFCETCRVEVAWAQNKAGKWYVCDTAQYSTEAGNERFRAVPYSFHNCAKNTERAAERAAREAEWEAEQEAAKHRINPLMAHIDVLEMVAAASRELEGTNTPEDDIFLAHCRDIAKQMKAE